MQKQQKFIKDTWDKGDTVVIGDRQYKIVLFHQLKNKVQVEYWDPHTGEKTKTWRDMDELPPYVAPTPDPSLNPSPSDGETVEDDADVVSTGPAVDSLLMHKQGMPADPADPPSVSPPTVQGETPAPAAPGEEEVYFEKGHERKNPKTGSTLKVIEPTVKGKYNIRLFFANGGTTLQEWGWQKIAKWGDVATTDTDKAGDIPTDGGDSYALTDEAKAVLEKEATQEIEVVTPDAEGKPGAAKTYQVELLPVPFVMRDGDGWHHVEAGKELNKYIGQGWALQHIDYQTIWIPAKSGKSESYVEMTVVWTLSRTVEVK